MKTTQTADVERLAMMNEEEARRELQKMTPRQRQALYTATDERNGEWEIQVCSESPYLDLMDLIAKVDEGKS